MNFGNCHLLELFLSNIIIIFNGINILIYIYIYILYIFYFFKVHIISFEFISPNGLLFSNGTLVTLDPVGCYHS